MADVNSDSVAALLRAARAAAAAAATPGLDLEQLAADLEAFMLIGCRPTFDMPRGEIRENVAAVVNNDPGLPERLGRRRPDEHEVRRMIDALTDEIAAADFCAWQKAQQQYGSKRPSRHLEGAEDPR